MDARNLTISVIMIMSLPTAILPTDQNQHPAVVDHLDAAIDGLQQRELLEPALLLSAGFLALPFVVRQALLLLAPLLALCGCMLERKETTSALPE